MDGVLWKPRKKERTIIKAKSSFVYVFCCPSDWIICSPVYSLFPDHTCVCGWTQWTPKRNSINIVTISSNQTLVCLCVTQLNVLFVVVINSGAHKLRDYQVLGALIISPILRRTPKQPPRHHSTNNNSRFIPVHRNNLQTNSETHQKVVPLVMIKQIAYHFIWTHNTHCGKRQHNPCASLKALVLCTRSDEEGRNFTDTTTHTTEIETRCVHVKHPLWYVCCNWFRNNTAPTSPLSQTASGWT